MRKLHKEICNPDGNKALQNFCSSLHCSIVVPTESVRLLQNLPYGVPEIEITAKYPIVQGQCDNFVFVRN